MRNYSVGGGGTPGGISNTSQLGGRTCREMEDGMRDLKKENFNLKLRIYFLEERLGAASSSFKAGSREELQEQNSSLKVRFLLGANWCKGSQSNYGNWRCVIYVGLAGWLAGCVWGPTEQSRLLLLLHNVC